jgi:hypothetical protein
MAMRGYVAGQNKVAEVKETVRNIDIHDETGGINLEYVGIMVMGIAIVGAITVGIIALVNTVVLPGITDEVNGMWS